MAHMNYRPGYYLSYFIYCMIPVTIYIYYLWQRKKDDDIIEVSTHNFITQFKQTAIACIPNNCITLVYC